MILTLIACLIFMIWCIVKAKGVGPIVKQPATIHGSELAWAMISGTAVCISNLITLTTYACLAFMYYIHILPYLQECARFWVTGEDSSCTDRFPVMVYPRLLRFNLPLWCDCQLLVANNLWGSNLVTCGFASKVLGRQSIHCHSIRGEFEQRQVVLH